MNQEINRHKAHFTDSRLYRQSTELAKGLLESSLPGDPLDLLYNIAFTLTPGSTFLIDEPRKLDRPIRRLSSHLTKLAQEASAYQFIPALHEAVPLFYSEFSNSELSWVGGALKMAAAALWTEMMGMRALGSKSQKSLIDLVVAAGALDRMVITKMVLTSTLGEGRIECCNGEMKWNDTFERQRKLFVRAFHSRGQAQRFSRLLSEAFFNGEGSLTLLARLRLSGSMELVQGRPEELFNVLHRVTDQDFWAGVWARLTLGALAATTRSAVNSTDDYGLAIIQEVAILDQAEFSREASELVQKHTVSLFWQQTWRKSLDLYGLRLAFVDRPVMRIDRMREVFATSAFNVLDSITSYFEGAAYNLQTDARFGHAESVYQMLFTRPFEADVENYLRSRGFRAGHVTEAGAWMTQDNVVELRDSSRETIPGEIDVLAVDSHGRALMVECKCLKMPHNISRLQTLLSGLGEEDAQGYFYKLRHKVEWLKKTNAYKGADILPVLVTDYPINFRSWETEGVLIVDRELLPALVDKLLS